jgi:hypothetical protein
MVTAITYVRQAIAEHVLRYRLITAEIVAERRLAGCEHIRLAEQLLEELTIDGFLQRGQLTLGYPTPRYYFLGSNAAAQFGESALATREQSLDDRLAHWAIAQFCATEKPFRELLTKDEFRAKFSSLWRPGQPLRYYLEPADGGARLAFLKVDLGGPSCWDRVVDACNRFLQKRVSCSPSDNPHARAQAQLFRQLIEQGRFQVTLLTARPEKAAAVRSRLDVDAVKHGARPPIVPYVVGGLFELLVRSAPCNHRRSRRR